MGSLSPALPHTGYHARIIHPYGPAGPLLALRTYLIGTVTVTVTGQPPKRLQAESADVAQGLRPFMTKACSIRRSLYTGSVYGHLTSV